MNLMADIGAIWGEFWRRKAVIFIGLLVLACGVVSPSEDLKQVYSRNGTGEKSEPGFLISVISLMQKKREMLFPHIWPDMEFGWRIVLGTVIAFLAAALGSVGGAGGGGIFVPMLILIIGFDPKSSTAISKCMVTGAALATVYYNRKLRHPSLDLPIIDYDLALLFQPMLVLGISIGVFFNVIFAEWMVTVLLMLLFVGTSTKAFIKGIETWNKETIAKREAARTLALDYNGSEDASYKLLPDNPTDETRMNLNEDKATKVAKTKKSWKKLGILVTVWLIILLLHVAKDATPLCSATYWTVTLLQIPVAVGAAGCQSVYLYKGWTVIESTGEARINWTVHQLVLCCFCGILAGIVGGLLGLGGGFILAPLFLELGIPPQVSSATSTLVMTFSSSMSVIQYYLLRRFPPSYALYFVAVATIAALVGQHVVRKMISILRRASIVIFILALVILSSAISLGWVGIGNVIGKVDGKEYMWFYNICEYEV